LNERRKVRATSFSRTKEEEGEDGKNPIDKEEEEIKVVEDEQELDPTTKRNSVFVPTKMNIHNVCQKIHQHDLSFLFSEVFPHLPERHIFECLKIIWQMTFWLSTKNVQINLPPESFQWKGSLQPSQRIGHQQLE
jgi:hypothetical protein